MKCEKCGEEISEILLDTFDCFGSDSDVLHQIQQEQEETGAVVIDTTQNWVGYELTEIESEGA